MMCHPSHQPPSSGSERDVGGLITRAVYKNDRQRLFSSFSRHVVRVIGWSPEFAGSNVHCGVGEDAHCERSASFLKALGVRVNACSALVSLLRCKLANNTLPDTIGL